MWASVATNQHWATHKIRILDTILSETQFTVKFDRSEQPSEHKQM